MNNGYTAFKMYCRSKLMQIHFSHELNRRLRTVRSQITSMAVHPVRDVVLCKHRAANRANVSSTSVPPLCDS